MLQNMAMGNHLVTSLGFAITMCYITVLLKSNLMMMINYLVTAQH